MVRSSAAVIPKVILRALLGTGANYRFEAMWMYLLVFLAALVVDTIPVFAPPAWTVLLLLLLTFHLNPWLVVVIGVTGSTLGRYVLSLYIPKISAALVKSMKRKALMTRRPAISRIFAEPRELSLSAPLPRELMHPQS